MNLISNVALVVTVLVALAIVAWIVLHYRDKTRWRKVSPWS